MLEPRSSITSYAQTAAQLGRCKLKFNLCSSESEASPVRKAERTVLITVALRALEQGRSNRFVAITVVGMFLNMAIVAYTAIKSIKRARALPKSHT